MLLSLHLDRSVVSCKILVSSGLPIIVLPQRKSRLGVQGTIYNVLLCVFSRFALRTRSHWIFNGFLAMKLQKLTSLVVLSMLTTGRFRVSCFYSSKDCGVHTRWTVSQIIIISKYLVFSLDFRFLGVLE